MLFIKSTNYSTVQRQEAEGGIKEVNFDIKQELYPQMDI